MTSFKIYNEKRYSKSKGKNYVALNSPRNNCVPSVRLLDELLV